MPQLTFPVQRAGLVVPVYVGLDVHAVVVLLAAGRPLPGLVPARGLLDTGADHTALAPWIVQQLGLARTATTTSHTTAGRVSVNLYGISLSITDPIRAGSPTLTQPSLRVSELTVA